MLMTSELWGRERFARQMALPEIGEAGQAQLAKARILIVGLGGLGAPIALYLTGAGIGHLGLMDGDHVSLSNLHRQILYTEADIGKSKALQAQSNLRANNSHISLEVIPEHFTADNAMKVIQGYDLVIDACDDIATRYLLADSCHLAQLPLIYGSVYRFEGQVAVWPAQGPCYRCLYPQMPAPLTVPSCNQAGVLGVTPGIIGLIQANEAINLILNWSQGLKGKVLNIDLKSMSFQSVNLPRNPECALCGNSPSIFDLKSSTTHLSITPEAWKKSAHPGCMQFLDVREVSERLSSPLEIQILLPPACEALDLHIPMNELEQESQRLSPDLPLLVYCETGRRSEQAATWLRQKGWKNVWSLRGGQQKITTKSGHPDWRNR